MEAECGFGVLLQILRVFLEQRESVLAPDHHNKTAPNGDLTLLFLPASLSCKRSVLLPSPDRKAGWKGSGLLGNTPSGGEGEIVSFCLHFNASLVSIPTLPELPSSAHLGSNIAAGTWSSP